MQPEPATHTTPSVIAGLIDRKQLAADLRCSERTIIRRERAGMPFIRFGIMRLYDPESVRAWIGGQEQRRDIPKVGRPRKNVA